MPKFVNTNSHRIYVGDPGSQTEDLTRIQSGETVDASEAFADRLDATPGVVRADSEEAKRFQQGEQTDQSPGLPTNHPDVLETALTRSGERQPVADEDLSDLTVKELRAEAKSREIEGYSDMKKAQLVKAIKKTDASGGEGGTITTEDVPSK